MFDGLFAIFSLKEGLGFRIASTADSFTQIRVTVIFASRSIQVHSVSVVVDIMNVSKHFVFLEVQCGMFGSSPMMFLV